MITNSIKILNVFLGKFSTWEQSLGSVIKLENISEDFEQTIEKVRKLQKEIRRLPD